MFNKLVLVVALLGLVCNTLQNFILPRLRFGGCPHLKVQQNFSATDYAGTWYIQMQYNLNMIHGDANCARENLVYDQLLNNFDLHYHQKPSSKKQWTAIAGTGEFQDTSLREGKLNTYLYNAGKKLTAKYWVLGTDYDFYSVVYSCKDYALFHTYSCWMMSREQIMWDWTEEDMFYSQVDKVLTEHGIDPYSSDLFTLVDQTNCAT